MSAQLTKLENELTLALQYDMPMRTMLLRYNGEHTLLYQLVDIGILR